MTSKKAQFFILVAIIVCMIIFLLVKNYNYIMESIELKDFEEKTNAYNRESVKVINYAIYNAPSICITGTTEEILRNPDCPPGALDQFSDKFVDYAKQSDPNYGLIYVYKMPDGSVIVKNMLGGWIGQPEGQAQAIKIEAFRQEGFNNIQVPIKGDVLLSAKDTSTGSICINGLGNVGCGSATTSVSNFGAGLNQKVIQEADSIIVDIAGTKISISLKEGWNGLQTSHRPEGNQDVSLIQAEII